MENVMDEQEGGSEWVMSVNEGQGAGSKWVRIVVEMFQYVNNCFSIM